MDNAVVCFFSDSQFFNGNIRSISHFHISDPCQTSKMEFFVKIVNDFLQNVKRYILDVWQGSECAFEYSSEETNFG